MMSEALQFLKVSKAAAAVRRCCCALLLLYSAAAVLRLTGEQQKEYERARSVAEMVLRANPANQTVEEHGRCMAGAEVHADGRQWR